MSSDYPTTKSNVCLFLLENITQKYKREQNKKKIPPILYYIVTLSKRNQLETAAENIVFGAKL